MRIDLQDNNKQTEEISNENRVSYDSENEQSKQSGLLEEKSPFSDYVEKYAQGPAQEILDRTDHIQTMLKDREVGERAYIAGNSKETEPTAYAWRDDKDQVHHIAQVVAPVHDRKENGNFQNAALDTNKSSDWKNNPGMDRAHSLAHGLGNESPYGILYATTDVNRNYQAGIEKYTEQYAKKNMDNPVFIETVTKAFDDTMVLEKESYDVYTTHNGLSDGKRTVIFSAEVTTEAGNNSFEPSIKVDDPSGELEIYLKQRKNSLNWSYD